MYKKSDRLDIDIDIDGGIATLSLKGNRFCPDLLKLLLSAFSRLKTDPEVAGLLLTGFSGASEGAGTTPIAAAAFSSLGQRVMFALDALGKPVIAAASGPTLAAELLDSARELLKGICRQGTLALRMAKEIVDAGQGLDLKTACLMERDAFALCFATPDQREGMGSFLERRPAQFKGK